MSGWARPRHEARRSDTKTPIKHVVVLFQENISFDHYFGTYPYATNPGGEPQFHADPDTPRANNLLSGGLLDQNPNYHPALSTGSDLPTHHRPKPRLHPRAKSLRSRTDGRVSPEYRDCGDRLPRPDGHLQRCDHHGIVMGYYDGNTVTAIWNWAQHYAMSDNFYGTMFGPSTVGVLNLVAGSTTHFTANTNLVAGGHHGWRLDDGHPHRRHRCRL